MPPRQAIARAVKNRAEDDQWTLSTAPDPKESLELHAGNPEMRDELGPLAFASSG